VGWKDLCIVRKRQEFLMNAVVEDRCQLLRSVGRGEIWASHIADEQSVSREDCLSPVGLRQIRQQHANTLDRMTRSLKEPKAALPEPNLISVPNGYVRKFSAGPGAERGPQIDVGARALGQFTMARDKVGVQMGLNNVIDLPSVGGRCFEIDVYVALGIDNGCNTFRRNHIRCVGQAT
jgi:hypothetical protein